jgi:hypothetical protein
LCSSPCSVLRTFPFSLRILLTSPSSLNLSRMNLKHAK